MSDRPIIVTAGDLVEDVIVTTSHAPRLGTDIAANIVRRRGGSAANVAVAVTRAGGRARFVGRVGADERGTRLVDELIADAVEPFVEIVDELTGTVVVLVADGERSFLTDRGASANLHSIDAAAICDASMLHITGYSFTDARLVEAIRTTTSRQPGLAVSVDASSVALLEEYGPSQFLEVCSSLGTEVLLANEEEAAVLALPEAALEIGVPVVVVKQGGASTVAFTATDRFSVDPIPITAPFDPTGAGDAFAGGFLVARASGASLRKAAQAGNHIAHDTLTNPRRSW